MTSQADIRKSEQRQEQRSNLYTPRGAATTFKDSGRDSYDVKNHMYPSDLMSPNEIYGGNYVIFYINVAVDSKLARTAGEDAFVNEMTPRDRGDLIAQDFSKTGLFASNATLSAGGALLGSALGIGGVSAAAGALSTVGAGATASFAATATRGQKRLKTAIALHMPNQLQIRYGMQWSEDDTTAIAMVGAAGDEIMNALKSKDGVRNLAEPAQAVVSNLALSKGPFASAMSAATGLAANPKKEQIFKGVDFRTFQFEYQFFPRSAEEADNVMNIIKELKYHMHPEFKDSNNFVYIYPSEFDIFYYQGGKENLNIHRHTSCVLTEMNVNYTPNGAFTTFSNGMPTQINIQLSFRELALLTKDKVKDGL